MLAIVERGSEAYAAALAALARRGETDLERVEPQVRAILEAVRTRGDAALRAYTEGFEQRRVERIVLDDTWREDATRVDPEIRERLAVAARRIRQYHQKQVDGGFRYQDEGIELGQRVLPVRAAGVYAPGGKARYPSTVLMAAIPAAVAGVPRIVLTTPRPTGEILAAAELAGVTEIVDAGGAQAIAALAYGTESVTRVDKIVGPGNIYVACAKRLVYGTVDIEGIAGPSEILVIADDSVRPAVVAADLLSQAEHDEGAYAILVAPTVAIAQAVHEEVRAQLATLPRRAIAEAALEQSYTFVTGDLDEAARVADALAPEHLALAVRDPDVLLPKIRAVGAVFLGEWTPEAAGDYAAGPSHVLPTGGAARHSSPLGVYDFLVRTSLIRYTRGAIAAQADLLEGLARLEGLEGHARAVAIRRG